MTSGIQKVSLVDAMVNLLLEQILNGEYPPGSPLPSERILQQKFQVSRMVLREALARLTALKIITVRHGKGAIVANDVSPEVISQILIPLMGQRDPQLNKELLQARNILEGEIAFLVAQKINQTDPTEIQQHFNLSPDQLLTTEQIVEWDLTFHRILARMAGSRFLFLMYESIVPYIRKFLQHYVSTTQIDAQTIMSRHHILLEEICSKDPERAKAAIQQHTYICYQAVIGNR